MAGKRKTTNIRCPKKLDLKALKVIDVLCPICRSILIEPVTLPCNHGFCSACFKDTMENANLVCPLCRTRVGSWYRKAKKENTLIDEAFWSAIKDSFPQEVQNKYDGLDSGIEEDKPLVVVADPGEIRKEYEAERKKEEQERKKIQDAEEKASAALIQKIKEEEEYRRLVEEEKLKLDAELARKLAEELKPSTSKQKRTPKKSLGPMDKFLHSSEIKKKSVKEYPSGVLCLDKFPKSRPNGSTNLVMPVVQKKIQQIHKILESEERKNTKPQLETSSTSTQLDNRYYFKPIAVFKKSPVDKKMLGKTPVTVPSRRVTVDANTPILSPIGRKPKLENRCSAFTRFSISEGSRPLISEVVEEKRSVGLKKASTDKLQNVDIMESEHEGVSKRSQNNNNLSSPQRKHHITRRIFQTKNSIVGSSGDDSPFLGFDQRKNSKNTTGNLLNVNKTNASLACSIPKSKLNDLNSSFMSNDSMAETFLGWARTKSTKLNNPTNASVGSNSSVAKLHKLNSSNVSKSITESYLGTKTAGSKNTRSHKETKLLEGSNNSITKLNKTNNCSFMSNNSLVDSLLGSSPNRANELMDSDTSGVFLGWSHRKKANATRTNKSKKDQSILSTLSSDEPTNLDMSITRPLLGFSRNKIDDPIDDSVEDPLNNTITEPFSGFDDTEKTNPFLFAGLNTQADVSPEISNSKIRQKRKPRTPKKNGARNGLSPEKKIKLRKVDGEDKERKLQEDADFELAKKLQAQFDDFAAPKRTRRGTTRQATLDEMLSF